MNGLDLAVAAGLLLTGSMQEEEAVAAYVKENIQAEDDYSYAKPEKIKDELAEKLLVGISLYSIKGERNTPWVLGGLQTVYRLMTLKKKEKDGFEIREVKKWTDVAGYVKKVSGEKEATDVARFLAGIMPFEFCPCTEYGRWELRDAKAEQIEGEWVVKGRIERKNVESDRRLTVEVRFDKQGKVSDVRNGIPRHLHR